MQDDKSRDGDRREEVRNGVFTQEGYSADITQPVDVEPVPKKAPGAAVDIRKDLPDSGAVEIHDDDDEILERERQTPTSK